MEAVRRLWLDRIIMSKDGSKPTRISTTRPTPDRVLGGGGA